MMVHLLQTALSQCII